MLSSWLARLARNASVVLSGLVLICPGQQPIGFAHAAAGTTALVKVVSYRGYRFEVPVGWPVFNVARQPQTCVRFDLHAVYLGTPGANQDCPSWLLGATETIVIQPGASKIGRAHV